MVGWIWDFGIEGSAESAKMCLDTTKILLHRNLMKGLTQNSAVCLIETNKSPTDTP